MRSVEEPKPPELTVLTAALSHAPAVIATGAVGLYLLGVMRSVGQLRASHVDLSQGFALIPLERHLRTGVAALFSMPALTIVAFYGVSLAVLLQLRGQRKVSIGQGSRPPEDVATSRVRSLFEFRWYRLAFSACAAVSAAFAGLVSPWPDLALLAVLAASFAAFYRSKGRGRLRSVLWFSQGVPLTALICFSGALAYFASNPLPYATVTMRSGKVAGPLIAINDGVIYLGSNRRDDVYQSVPVAQVVRVSVERRRRVDIMSIVQMLGWNFPNAPCVNTVHKC